MAESGDDGPAIVRPIPRRPFNLNLMSATPPDEELDSSSPSQEPQPALSATPQWLQRPASGINDDGVSLSRPESFMNLTSSTLFGIFSPTVSTRDDGVFGDREETDTPWGTGAQTPIKRPSVDEATFALMRERSHLTRRRSSYQSAEAAAAAATQPPTSASITALSLSLRASLLGLLGVGYGALVTQFQGEPDKLETLVDGIIRPGYNWKYLAFWGMSGVLLGALLPWFDRIWEATFGAEDLGEDEQQRHEGGVKSEKDTDAGTDWALVIRAIGAFVGIVFAIRKLPWASTSQASVTLALVNPLLWWIIDRSVSGFILSATVGLTGSMLLLGVDPEMMSAPQALTSSSAHRASNSSSNAGGDELALGGLTTQRTIETGVWILSVLFCSCVCFGNIGRRLFWSRSVALRGRWGGVR